MAYNRSPAPQSVALVARVERPPAVANDISIENWQLLTDVIWPGAKDAAVIVTAWNYCKARRLDPFKRPVHIVSAYNSALGKSVETIWPGIGELQITAARTGQYAGMDSPVWGPLLRRHFVGTKKEWNPERDVATEMDLEFPESCEVTVYRLVGGQPRAFSAPTFFLEAYGRASFKSEVPNDRWSKAPRQMLMKCAKAAALRAAFPEEIGNDYTNDEMEGREVEVRQTIEHGELHRPAAPVHVFPLGGAGSGVEQDKRPGHEKNIEAREAATRATQPKKAPPAAAKQPEPPPEDRPNYPFTAADGQVYDFHTGTEYLRWFREQTEKIGFLPKLLREFGDAQKEHLVEISEFDPSAAVDAGELLEIALKGPAT